MRGRWEAPDTRFFFVEPGRRLRVLRPQHPFTRAGAMERRDQRGILRNSPRGSLRVCGSLSKWDWTGESAGICRPIGARAAEQGSAPSTQQL